MFKLVIWGQRYIYNYRLRENQYGNAANMCSFSIEYVSQAKLAVGTMMMLCDHKPRDSNYL